MPLTIFAKFLKSRTIMITGGSGSFGQHCTKKLLDLGLAKKIVIYSRGELRQWEMQRKFAAHPDFDCLRFFVGDVRDRLRLSLATRDVDYIIHAAAMKHITACEYNPTEAVHTNILGTENIVLAAISGGISRCVLVSTDKAVSPVNLYGSTKLAAEKIMVAGNNLSGASITRFAVVRYGNVVGSSGSVVPLFLHKIANNEPLPITDPRMTRFLMRIGHGVDLVLNALATLKGGEIIIPKAASANVMDIAHAMHPKKEKAPTKIIGIRAGEKLHEALISSDDSSTIFEDKDKFISLPNFQSFAKKDPYKEIRTTLKPRKTNAAYDSANNKKQINGIVLKKLLEEGIKDFQPQ